MTPARDNWQVRPGLLRWTILRAGIVRDRRLGHKPCHVLQEHVTSQSRSRSSSLERESAWYQYRSSHSPDTDWDGGSLCLPKADQLTHGCERGPPYRRGHPPTQHLPGTPVTAGDLWIDGHDWKADAIPEAGIVAMSTTAVLGQRIPQGWVP